jgi:lipopolysaccharide biosynthesis glycosyltransferase
MLINVGFWREHNIKDEVMDIIREKADVLDMPDQDALNLAFGGRWKKLAATYNVQMVMFTRYQELLGEVPDIDMALCSPTIVHFSATNKQWHYSCFLKYAKEYRALDCSIMVKKRTYFVDRLVGLYHRYYHKVWLRNSYV